MFNKKLIAVSILAVTPTFAFAHGNVDVSNGSQIEIYKANENHYHAHGDHAHLEKDEAYGFEAIWMDDSGFFLYGEAEAGAHDFYQLGAGQYFKPTKDLGWFVYGSYAQGGYADSNELRARVGVDYQLSHELTLQGRIGYDYGNSETSLGHEPHSANLDSHDHHDSANSHLGRFDAGFTYELGHVAEFSYNYVVQKQFESDLVADNDTNLHYEARLTYTDTKLMPYVEYRQTNKAFDKHDFEESAVQFGVSFQY
jgi:hypothetical protein